MKQKLSKLFRLTLQDWYLLLKVGLVLLAARTALSIFRFGSIKRWMNELSPSAPEIRVDAEKYRARVVWAVSAIGYRLFGDRPCLPVAIATQYLLVRAGQEVEIRIGVAKENNQRLAAHAWVEDNGRIIIGGNHASVVYEPLEDVR